MSAFPNWKEFAVHQKRWDTGCIPTAFEIMLRAAGVQGVDFAAFQDDFDLDMNGGTPRNNFDSVASAVKAKYPNISFQCERFPQGDGSKKLARVEELIRDHRPVSVSLANAAFGGRGWHIMMVVDSTDLDLILLQYVDKQGTATIKNIARAKYAEIHDHYPGGDDICYLKK